MGYLLGGQGGDRLSFYSFKRKQLLFKKQLLYLMKNLKFKVVLID